MIYHLNVYGCDNKYDHTPLKLLYQRTNYSGADAFLGMIGDYRSALKNRDLTVLHIIVTKVDCEAGTVEILVNELGTVQPRTRTIINPAAEALMKKKRADKKTITGGPSFVFDDFVSVPQPSDLSA